MFSEADLGVASSSLGLMRYYNNSGPAANIVVAPGILGDYWRTNFDRRVYALDSAIGAAALAIRPDARVKYFDAVGNELMHFNGTPAETLVPLPGGGWQLTSGKDEVETYDAQGRLIGLWDKVNSQTTLTYDAAGQLATVVDARGRSLSFAYSGTFAGYGAGWVTVTSSDGKVLRYDLDGLSNLVKVTYPDTSVRQYLYESVPFPNYVTGIVDENAKRYETVEYYDDIASGGEPYYGRAKSSYLAPVIAGGVSRNTFTYNANGTTTVVDSMGATRTYSFAVTNHVTNLAAVSQPCASCGADVQSRSYDNIGYLDLATDFRGIVTDHDYDLRGLETQRIEASNDTSTPSSKRTIQTDWHPTFRVPTERRTYNTGNILEAKSQWTYNPRGQVTAKCDIDPTDSTAMAYTCSATTAPPVGAKVRRWTYAYCEQSDVDAPNSTCPLLGLTKSVNGPRASSDAGMAGLDDVTTYTYFPGTDESGCATLGGACHRKGDLWKVTNALDQVTETVSVDKAGRVTRSKDTNGTLTDFTYHPRGWLLTRTVRANASGMPDSVNDATTRFNYDNVGQVTRVTQPDGAYLNYTYDDAHRLTDIVDNLNNRLHYTLDAAGNRVKEDTYDANYNPVVPGQGLKRSLSRVYNQLNRLTQSLNAATQPTRDSTPFDGSGLDDGYDANGNTVHVKDGLNVETVQEYDPLNRLTKTMQDYLGPDAATRDTTTKYEYDARDNLRKVTDPDNLDTVYDYDGLNNLTGLHSPDTGNTAYTYDLAGNRSKQTDARGSGAVYTYDALNRLVGIGYTPDKTLEVSFAYDQANSVTACASSFPQGRLTKITDSSGSTVYCYDRRGNVTKKTQTAGADGTSAILATAYAYTNADRLQTLTYPSGAIVGYTRNAIGQISSMTWRASAGAAPVTVLSNVAYLPFGPLTSLTFGNGRTLSKAYDANYQIDAVSDPGSGGLTLDFTPDVMGNIVAASPTLGGGATRNYKYDHLYRLGEVDTGANALVEGFGYNKTGDRTSKTLPGQAPQVYVYLAGTHRLGSVAGSARGYDANGNTTQRNGQALSYDDRNRLADVPVDASHGTRYNYNGRGERVSKLRYAPDAYLLEPVNCSVLDVFSYDERGQLLSEYSSGAINETMCSGGEGEVGLRTDPVESKRPAQTGQANIVLPPPNPGAIPPPQPVADYLYLDATPVAVMRGGQLYYLEADHLGTPRVAVNASNNSAVWGWDFFGSAFGEHGTTGTSGLVNLRYPGQYADGETGLNYNYFRDYEAGTGRYVESDPIGLGGGLSTFAYANGDPVGQFDQFGLTACNGKWMKVGEFIPTIQTMAGSVPFWGCVCYWACIPCRGSRAYAYDQLSSLPATQGHTFVDFSWSSASSIGVGGTRPTPNGPKPGRGGAMGGRYSCLCTQKPGPEESCNDGKCYPDSNFYY